MSRLAGKRAFVTGAGQGIGRATVLAFAREGAEVVAVSRTAGKMAGLAGDSVTVSEVDVNVTPKLLGAIEDAGQIDILVNCAGWVHSGTVIETSSEEWQRSFDVNATAAFQAIRAVLPHMLERGAGSIVNVASVASSISGVPRRIAYGASKAALIGLTKAVAREAAARGVRCNALCPGMTDTPSLAERIAATADPSATRGTFTAGRPMGRLGTPEEMAAAIVFLASDESAFMTGQLLVIDGGQSL